MRKLKGDRFTLSRKASIFSKPVLYFLAVSFGFGVDFSIYAVLSYLGYSIYLANVLGFCVGASVNVLLIRWFVFSDSRFNLHTDILISVLANGLMLCVGMVLLWLMVEFFLFNPYLAKFFANCITFVLNYITRLVFFRKKSNVF